MASTEQQIKDAARTLFMQQGYAATTTRDIAKASGSNVALINYYFRSKEQLFAEIMVEQVRSFAHGLGSVINDPETTLQEKFVQMADAYLTLFEQQPDTPLFVLTEIRRNPEQFLHKIDMDGKLKDSVLFKQLKKAMRDGTIKDTHPLHVFMNLLSLLVFPYIAKPMLMGVADVSERSFTALMQERRNLVPLWIDAMFTQR